MAARARARGPSEKLAPYRAKRDFTRTAEPAGEVPASATGRSFVVQQHAATRMHWDFRLELDGVLLSWAVPKGPSLDPAEKRLAVQTEDHPIEYGGFEGVIPKGEYGGGSVVVWDRGTWEPVGDPRAGLQKGHLEFVLRGEKLLGRWHLVRTKRGDAAKQWLLFKAKDEVADPGRDLVAEQPHSVITGRRIDEVAADADRVWDGTGERRDLEVARKGPKPAIEGAKKAKQPPMIEPELATLVDAAPAGASWIHEIKFDGYRAVIRVEGGKAQAWSRNGKDWSRPFAPIVAACAALPARSAWLDGEVCVARPDGTTDFQTLQNDLGGGRTDRLVFYAFDLLYLDGYDLRGAPLVERKRLLQELLEAGPSGPIQFSEHFTGEGPAFFESACRMDLEGIVSKRADSVYRSARTRDWLKVKCVCSDEVLIGGFTAPKGSRQGFGALLVGQYDAKGRLTYAGRVGTGFSDRTLRDLLARMQALEVATPPFDVPKGQARGARWVSPELVASVTYSESTRDGLLRHPSFQGLREDVEPRSVARRGEGRASGHTKARPVKRRRTAKGEVATVAGVQLTHPDKALYGDIGLTKLELALYYERHADRILPHIVDRPLTLVRCPDGHGGPCFYQRHASQSSPNVRSVLVDEAEGSAPYVYIDDLHGLVTLVQFGVLEIHPWGARVDDLERPDVLIFDLDPDEGLPRARLVEAVADVRDRLVDLGLAPFLKTTGGKGFHVVAPLVRRQGWDEVNAFARAVAEGMVRDAPDRYVSVASKAKRRGKVFVDWLRNARAATAVAPWSTRARPGAPIAVPIPWEELGRARPDGITVRSVDKWVETHGDPWEGLASARRSITKAMLRKVGVRAPIG